jgi:hypothetical protein
MPSPAARPHKYTVLFDPTEFGEFDRALLDFQSQVGRRVDKSEVIRSLARLFVRDASVAAKVSTDLDTERSLKPNRSLADDGPLGL